MVIPREEKNQLKSIFENWNLGFLRFRLQRISLSNSTPEIINEWKNYTIPLGYKLVSRKQKKK